VYMCFPQHHKSPGLKFPALNYHEHARQMRLFHQLGVRGLFNNLAGGLYVSKGVAGKRVSCWPSPIEDFFRWYVIIKMADDPALDEDALVDEFCRNWFGRAAPAIKAFVLHAEKIYDDPKRVLPNGRYWRRHNDVAWGAVCLKEDMAILGRHMAEARRLAETPEARSRVKLFEDGIWRLIVSGRAKWEKRQARDKK